MNLQIELFSTPTVEGRKILSSKGFVCANVVLGARVIDDEYIAKSYGLDVLILEICTILA